MSENRAWALMTKSHGGTVSVIRDLTLEECRAMYERLDPFYGQHSTRHSVHKDYLPEGVQAITSGGIGYPIDDGHIEAREVFGPPSWDGSEVYSWNGRWPKITTIWTDDKGKPLDPQPDA